MDKQHKIITIGGSAGGLQPLIDIITSMSSDHPVSVFVVIHGLGKRSIDILNNKIPESAEWDIKLAENGEIIEPGLIFFAPSDHHLLVEKNKVRVTQGPHVNMSRPAIDLLFRSAAVDYRTHTIGVLLSGSLYDGINGVQAIKRCGGIAVVQDPDNAKYPDLPNNLIEASDVDYIKPASEIGSLLSKIVKNPVNTLKDIPEEITIENKLDLRNDYDISAIDKIGTRSSISCPECGGPLWEISGERSSHFRCHTGHSVTINDLLEGQNTEIERTLRVALRTLEEKMQIQEKISKSDNKLSFIIERNKERLEETKNHVIRLRKFIVDVLSKED